MSSAFRYPTLHWLLTVVAAPVLLLSYVFATEGMPGLAGDGVMMFWVFLVGGALLSVPTYVLYLVVFIWLFERVRSPLVLKAICNMLVIGCTGLTFWLLGGFAIEMLFLSYATAVILNSFLLKIRPPVKPVTERVGQ